MFNLVLKDLILQKKITIFSVFYGIVVAFSSVVAGKTDASFIISTVMNAFFIITMTYFSVLYADGYDEKNKAFYIINSLPIKKSYIATSKYISFLVYMAIYSILIMILSSTAAITFKVSNIPYIYSIIISFIVLSFIYSIYYPLYFKFGMEMLKLYRIFMILFMCIVPSYFANKFKLVDRNILMGKILWIKGNLNVLIIITLLISIILLVLSLMFSIKIYKNKDF